MIETVMTRKFSRSSFEIQNVSELLGLYLGDHIALCYVCQESGMVCIWLNQFEVLLSATSVGDS